MRDKTEWFRKGGEGNGDDIDIGLEKGYIPSWMGSLKKMSRCEHNHLAHYKPFCLCCKFKFYYPEILRVVGGADTPKILLLNLN